MRLGLLLALVLSAHPAWGGDAAPAAGVTILGDQDSALGLVLAPWKEESASEMHRPPALQDAQAQAMDVQAYARAQRYYQTGRAYRSERLQRNK